MKTVLLMMSIVAVGLAEASTLTNLTVRSAKMDRDIPVSVVLPEGYGASCETRYPSVWILHGAGGSAVGKASEKCIGELVDRYGFIGICPDGGKTSWWLNSPIDSTCQYETFVIAEALPFIDANYRTIVDRTKRGIMGGSMGGHGACYLGIRHKDLFGAIGNIYGGVDLTQRASHWDLVKRLGKFPENISRWEENSVINVAKTLKNGEVELVCVLGTSDFFLACNRQLHDLLSANGVAHTYVEVRSDTTQRSLHGQFYAQGAEISMRFIANYFKDGYGHLGDIDTRAGK